MIPGDINARLRSMLEAIVEPISPTRTISDDLPRMQPGQRFLALIERPLPDGSFRALVAGKSITLALPESVKSGDTLELQVTEQRGNTVHARPLLAGAGQATDLPRPTLSQAGQIISQLLTGRHGEARPLPLQQTSGVLTPSPGQAATLAPMLRQAISQSGMFYESHLRQWAEGKFPLSNLLKEPQGQLSSLSTGNSPATPQTGSQPPLPAQAPAEAPETASLKPPPGSNASALSETEQVRRQLQEANQPRPGPLESATKISPASRQIAEPLTPVVLQQLEALASNLLSWQGMVWPGMQLQWSVSDPDSESGQSSSDEEGQIWRSTLRVDLPNIGGVQARLLLGPQGLRIQLDTDNANTAQSMRAGQSSLIEALEAAGISLQQLTVSEHVSA